MNFVISGADGFIGWHLRCFLLSREASFVSLGRESFGDPELLAEAVASADVFVHLAGANRAGDREIRDVNVGLAQRLVEACESANASPHLIFASSTHVDREPPTAYGMAKREASDTLSRWASDRGAHYTELVIPHVFGENGRPFYNSAVATFCHQLANEIQPQIEKDSDLELLHVQDLCERIMNVAEKADTGQKRIQGAQIRVSDVLRRLESIKSTYEAGILPELHDPLSLRLFNTLRSYYYPHRYPYAVPLHEDQRGRLFEAVKALSGGQCFVSTTRPGVTRGNHFHRYKLERFLVLHGRATIRIRRLFDVEPREFHVEGGTPAYIDIPTLQTHEITNTGDEDLVTLFWAHEIFDPQRPDTYAHPVDAGKATA